MRDTFKAVLVLTIVPVLATVGLSESCGTEVVGIASTILSGLAVAVWKWKKG